MSGRMVMYGLCRAGFAVPDASCCTSYSEVTQMCSLPLHSAPWKTCHSTFVHYFGKCSQIFKILSLLDSAVNLPWDSFHISHLTCNVSLHYLVKIIISKIAIFQHIYKVSPFCLIVDKINQINLTLGCCVLLSLLKLNAKMSSFGTDACIETFATLEFMTSMKWSSIWRWSGVAWNKIIGHAMNEWHKYLWACIYAKGRHFEHLVRFKSTCNANV